MAEVIRVQKTEGFHKERALKTQIQVVCADGFASKINVSPIDVFFCHFPGIPPKTVYHRQSFVTAAFRLKCEALCLPFLRL